MNAQEFLNQDTAESFLSKGSAESFLSSQSAEEFLSPPSKGEVISQTLESNPVQNVLAAPAEALTNVVTGMAGQVAGGLASLGTMATNYLGLTKADPSEVISDVGQAVTVSPQSKLGKSIMDGVAAPFEWWRENVSSKVGEAALEPRQDIAFGNTYIPQIHKPREGGGAAEATLAYTLSEVAPWLVLPKAAKKTGEVVSKGIEAAKKINPKRITDPVNAIVEPVKEAFTPIATGSTEARLSAKKYANSIRESDTLRNEIVSRMDKKFTKQELKAMGEAQIADELAVSRGTIAENGVKSLPMKSQQAIIGLMERHKPIADAAVELGILKKSNDIYFPRKVAEQLGEEVVSRIEKSAGVKLTTSTKHAMKRKYETVEETAAAASEKLGKNVEVIKDIRVLPLVTAELERAIAGKTLVNEIKSYSKKLGVDTVLDGKKEGYFTINHPSMYEWKPRLQKTEGKYSVVNDEFGNPIFDKQPIYIHESFRGPLEAVLKNESGKIADAFMTLKAKSMSMIMFNPLMHGMVIWGKALPFQPYRTLTFRNYADGRRIYNGPEADYWISHATKHGMAPIGNQAWMQRMNDVMQTPKLTAGRSWTAQTAGAVAKPFGKQQAAMEAIDKAGHLWHDTLLWEPIRHAQMGMYKNLFDNFTKGGMSEEAAGQLAAHLSNRFAGSIPFEDMGHGVRATANFMLFSRTFNATNIGIYKDAIKGLPKAVQEQIIQAGSKLDAKVANSALRRQATATLAKDIAAMYILNSMIQNAIQYWKTGDAGEIAKEYADNLEEYNKKVEENPLNYLLSAEELTAQSLNEPGKQARVYLGQDKYGTGVYLRNPFGKIGEDLQKFATSPIALATDKLSPTMKFIAGVATNDKSINKGYGIPVYGKHSELKDAPENLGKVLMFFMEAHTPSGFIENIVDVAMGKDPTGVGAAKVAGQLAGFSVSSGAPGGPAAGLMYDTLDKRKQMIREYLPDAVKELRLGNNEKAREIMVDKAGMTPSEITTAINKIYPMFNEKTVHDFVLASDKYEQRKLNRMIKKYYGKKAQQ